MAGAPSSLVAIAEQVDARLRQVIDAEAARWGTLDPALVAPFDALRALVLGSGKRLRPAFCRWGWVAAGGRDDDTVVVDAGAAIELLHAFALFHDDVMDGSATRRGEPSTHVRFADQHAASSWRGEARRFGEGVAILVGDLAFVYADHLLAGAPEAAWRLWHELRVELNIGQYLDLVGTAKADRRLASAALVARYKSGKYTIERPLHLGATIAAPERGDLRPQLSAYGLPLGDAFQLRDDVLGVFGTEQLLGKPVGDDLREGKPTMLLAVACERADAAQQAMLDRVGRADLTADDVAGLQQVLVDTGAVADIEQRIEIAVDEALRALDAADIVDEARKELAELAQFVAWREH